MKTEQELLKEVLKHLEEEKYKIVNNFFYIFRTKDIKDKQLKQLYKNYYKKAKEAFSQMSEKEKFNFICYNLEYNIHNSVDFIEEQYLKLFSEPLQEHLKDNYTANLHILAKEPYFKNIVKKYHIDLNKTVFFDNYIGQTYYYKRKQNEKINETEKIYYQLNRSIISNIVLNYDNYSFLLDNMKIYELPVYEGDKHFLNQLSTLIGLDRRVSVTPENIEYVFYFVLSLNLNEEEKTQFQKNFISSILKYRNVYDLNKSYKEQFVEDKMHILNEEDKEKIDNYILSNNTVISQLSKYFQQKGQNIDLQEFLNTYPMKPFLSQKYQAFNKEPVVLILKQLPIKKIKTDYFIPDEVFEKFMLSLEFKYNEMIKSKKLTQAPLFKI